MEPNLSVLLDIEAIKSLKARYFRCMDTRDWEGLRLCFTEDLVADFRAAPGMLSQGRDNYMSALKEALTGAQTVHHGHTPEISIVNQHEAEGTWAMEDLVELPSLSLQGWGHYHERYRREQEGWKICYIRLSRLRLMINGELQSHSQEC
ncbi:MAG: nuclear transport factor 2 family protein [Pseudomonadota bacterium]